MVDVSRLHKKNHSKRFRLMHMSGVHFSPMTGSQRKKESKQPNCKLRFKIPCRDLEHQERYGVLACFVCYLYQISLIACMCEEV